MKMKKSWALVGILAIFTGLLLMAGAFLSVGFDLSGFNGQKFSREHWELEGAIEEIEIYTSFCDVKILPAAQGEAPSLYTPYSESVHYNVFFENGKLTVCEIDAREWYENVGIFYTRDQVTTTVELRLTPKYYKDLKIVTSSGDINVQGKIKETDAFTIRTLWAETSSGEIDFCANVVRDSNVGGSYFQTSSGDITVSGIQDAAISAVTSSGEMLFSGCVTPGMNLKSSSGDIEILNVDCETGEIQAETSTGEVDLLKVKADTIALKSSTGDITLSQVLTQGKIQIMTSSGEVELENSDAGSLFLRSSSGDITLELLTAKNFLIETSSGSKHYPPSEYSSGLCEVKTSSGDVEITVVAQ